MSNDFDPPLMFKQKRIEKKHDRGKVPDPRDKKGLI